MNTLGHYRDNLALLTDLYQITMGYGYWKRGMERHDAVFHLTFRKPPFGGSYAIAAGTEPVVEYLESLRFGRDDAEYLRTLTGNDGEPLFDPGYIDFLRDLQFECDVDIVPEGSVVFAHEPLVRVRGPLLQAQLVETPLLNMVNFQTLVATKASRVCRAARGGSVLEFGLRRAQGVDGGLAASRAAFIGGCSATSNVLAGKLFGIPVKGTHAHSWVMAFEEELQAFQAYAEAMPNNSLFLVDTYDTIAGVHKAVQVGRQLDAAGHRMAGIRLDSGDLGALSRQARAVLDEAGFPDAVIVASNDLDEFAIEELVDNGAQIAVWGIGTKLATCFDQPALGGVYKLAAIRSEAGEPWRPVIKLSEQSVKMSNPTAQQVSRYRRNGRMVGDVIHTVGQAPGTELRLASGELHRLPEEAEPVALLEPGLRAGTRVGTAEDLTSVRERCLEQLQQLPPATLLLSSPEPFPVGLAPELFQLKQRLIAAAQ